MVAFKRLDLGTEHDPATGDHPGLRRGNLRSPSHERTIRLIEDQFAHFPVRAEMELHPVALKLVDGEGSALVGA